jgi:hypothetical protein
MQNTAIRGWFEIRDKKQHPFAGAVVVRRGSGCLTLGRRCGFKCVILACCAVAVESAVLSDLRLYAAFANWERIAAAPTGLWTTVHQVGRCAERLHVPRLNEEKDDKADSYAKRRREVVLAGLKPEDVERSADGEHEGLRGGERRRHPHLGADFQHRGGTGLSLSSHAKHPINALAVDNSAPFAEHRNHDEAE